MLTKITFLISLALFWLVIAGFDGIIHYPILSFISVISIFAASCYYNIIPKKYYNPFRLLTYIFWLIREIIVSSLNVAAIIWNPHSKIKPIIAELETDFAPSSAEIALYANSITLTPGTYAVDIENSKLIVHSLTTTNLRDLKSGLMQKEIKKMLQQT